MHIQAAENLPIQYLPKHKQSKVIYQVNILLDKEDQTLFNRLLQIEQAYPGEIVPKKIIDEYNRILVSLNPISTQEDLP